MKTEAPFRCVVVGSGRHIPGSGPLGTPIPSSSVAPEGPPAIPQATVWVNLPLPEEPQETVDSTLLLLAAIEWQPGGP